MELIWFFHRQISHIQQAQNQIHNLPPTYHLCFLYLPLGWYCYHSAFIQIFSFPISLKLIFQPYQLLRLITLSSFLKIHFLSLYPCCNPYYCFILP